MAIPQAVGITIALRAHVALLHALLNEMDQSLQHDDLAAFIEQSGSVRDDLQRAVELARRQLETHS